MITMTFATISIVLFAATIAAMSVVATRSAVSEAAFASPFGSIGLRDQSADTLQGGTAFRVFPPAAPGEWQVLTCDTLRDVENTLDSLENHGIRDREVVAMSNSCFAVRWKC